MKRHKLPFNITLERKYNDINAEKYLPERDQNKDSRKARTIDMDNDLHIELGKFKTFDMDLSEITDLGLRYALSKHEFRKLAAQVLDLKINKIKV